MIPDQMLLRAYRMGIFPMAEPDGGIAWFSPDPRGVLPIGEFHVPHGLRRTLRAGRFEVRVNSAFERVMRACAARPETWINATILESYSELHAKGHAHSVETWQNGRLVGGLYGVAIGGAFFGESMFHHVTDASKVALCALVERLRERNYSLLDIQWTTPHLLQFGAREIARREYLVLLEKATAQNRRFM